MFEIEKNGLAAEIYEELRDKVHWQHYDSKDVRQALQHTLFSVVIRENGRPVGIGRVVGDGRIAFFIKDVVVEPSRQRQGIGRMIMEQLMDYIRRDGCPNAYVGLMSLDGTESFYEQFGFQKRPHQGLGCGMTQLLENTAASSMEAAMEPSICTGPAQSAT